MRVAILTSEAVPFAKTGGLADVSGALPKALTQEGVDAKLILPLYDQIDRGFLNGESIEEVRVEWRGGVRGARTIVVRGKKRARIDFVRDPAGLDAALVS